MDLVDQRLDMLTYAKSEKYDLLRLSPVYIATVLDNLEFVKHLIEKNGVNPMDKDENEETLLHYAAMHGRLNILKYLVEDLGCNPATESSSRYTTLHAAAYAKQLHIIKYLIEQCGLDPSNESSFHYTPLSYVCSNGELKIARYLVQQMLKNNMEMKNILYIENDISDPHVTSPLCCACVNGHLSIVKYLVDELGCDPWRCEGGNKIKMPLAFAVRHDHLDIVKFLSTTTKHAQNIGAIEVMSLLDSAVKNQNLEMIEYLTKSFHCDFNSKYRDTTLLHSAVLLGNLSIVKYLTSLNCDPCAKVSNDRQPIFM